ncbi:hypothetical protein NDU88_009911 [Pleurodeles waltl]|uniref:Uncharacterized protein n=1 Tax=Pleurodeles waltl TaxID=8319 RepID=A0AAV7QWQ6_PLEWA|nr:hypothetical protein NDU88_009911 [Pleurodeles waltl]
MREESSRYEEKVLCERKRSLNKYCKEAHLKKTRACGMRGMQPAVKRLHTSIPCSSPCYLRKCEYATAIVNGVRLRSPPSTRSL